MVGSWFRRGSDALEEVQSTGNRLGIFTLNLTGVKEPFDPDPVWDRRYGGRAEIEEALTGDRDFRLQEALDGCRNTVFQRDSAGRFRETNPIFTDVVMWIPQAVWRADAMRGGGRIEALQHALAALHEDKFSRSLPEGRRPRYTIMADRELGEDSVAFQFGFGVFVPGEEDELVSEVGLLRPGESQMQGLPPWMFWQGGAQTQRPVGVYEGQRSLLVSGSHEGPIRPTLWFQATRGNVLVNFNEADAERVYADTEEIRVARSRTSKEQPGLIEWRLDSHVGTERESLWLRVAPVGQPVGPAPRAPDRSPAKAARPAKPDDPPSTPLSARFSLHLAGLGLFRNDAARIPGLEQWVIWLNEFGWPLREAAMQDVDEKDCLAIRMRSGSDQIEVRAAGGAEFEPVASLPFTITTQAGGELALLPPPVPGRYQAVLTLNDGLVLPLSPKALTLGRATESTSAQPDLPVELLDHPNSVAWEKGAARAGITLDAIDLSRRHVTVRLDDGHLEVGMAKGSAPAFALDESLRLKTELAPRSSASTALEPGEHLLIGGYLFRFQRERALAVTSTATHTIPVPRP